MHVPIDGCDALEAVGRLRVPDRDADIAEQAKTHAEVGDGMMSGRAHQRVGILHVAPHDCIQRADRAAGGEQRDLEAAATERRQVARVASSRGAHGLDVLDMRAGMDPFDFVFGGGARLKDLQMIDQTADFDQIAEATLRFRVFVRRTGLHAEARRKHARRGAGVVPHIELVTEPTRRHCHRPRSCCGASPISNLSFNGRYRACRTSPR